MAVHIFKLAIFMATSIMANLKSDNIEIHDYLLEKLQNFQNFTCISDETKLLIWQKSMDINAGKMQG